MLSVFDICPGRTFLSQNHGLGIYVRSYLIKAHVLVLQTETIKTFLAYLSLFF